MQGSRLEGYGGFRKTVQREMGRYKRSLSLVGKDWAAKENHDGHRLQGSMLQPAKWMEEAVLGGPPGSCLVSPSLGAPQLAFAVATVPLAG